MCQNVRQLANLTVVLNEIEKDDVLALVLNGQMKRKLRLVLEHLVQQLRTHVGEARRVQLLLLAPDRTMQTSTDMRP